MEAPPLPAPVTQQLVLVLEDNEHVQQTICDQLAALGYLTIAATTGQEALSYLARSTDIQIFISDVQLAEGEDGAEIAQQALQHNPHLQVLLISGHDERRLTATAPLSFPLLHKPFHRQELAAALQH